MAWLDSLSAAVDLSPALDERTLPQHQTLPGRRRRRGRQIIEEQERIMRSQFPHLISAVPEEEDYQIIYRLPHRNSHESLSELALRELRLGLDISTTPPVPSTQRVISPLSASSASDSSSAAFTTSSVSSRRERHRASPSTYPSPAAPSTEQTDGKWRPSDTLTPEANLRYARRCMAILCEDSPRQSDYIVKDGKRYRLVWDTRKLVPAWSHENRNGYPSEERHESAGTLPQYGEVANPASFMVGAECRTTTWSRRVPSRRSPLETDTLDRRLDQAV